MVIYSTYDSACPTRAALDLIADKWTILVLGLLEKGPQRFSSLQRSIKGISQKMLVQNLRGLERNGLVLRTVYPEVPPHVEYELTKLGQTLTEPIAAVRVWSEKHIEKVITAQKYYDKKSSPI